MVRVALIRHGMTDWNRQGRIQGRTDVPLCEAGRLDLASRARDARLETLRWVSSPLARARETAAILSGRPEDEIATDERLIEMSWGEWEGHLLTDLRRDGGAAVAANEARGLDFRPPGGESPADVQRRALDWLADVAVAGEDLVAVTHKGVIRAVMARALDWDMTGKSPVRFDWSKPYMLEAVAGGAVRAVATDGSGDD